MKHIYQIFVLFTLFSTAAFSQKSGNIWYFGANKAVDFNPPNGPVAIANSAMSTIEGSASICNRVTGQLLFYTDGKKVWNKNNIEMPNGNGLFGNASSTQSAVIVPQPGTDSLYYIFTVDAEAGAFGSTGYGGLSYSIADLRLDGGLGDVTIKNQPLLTPTTEKITAVAHCNGKDIWLITHQWQSDAFYAYLVTATGISAPFITTGVGSVHQGLSGATHGYMKASPNGKKLALATGTGMNSVEIFDFNNVTGALSNPIVDILPSLIYGVSFSPDNNLLYVSAQSFPSEIVQYNLSAGGGSAAAVIASRTTVASSNTSTMFALQLAVNGKIYAIEVDGTLNVINKPNIVGTGCDFDTNAVNTAGGGFSFSLGLPTFIESSFNALNLGNDTIVCSGEIILDAGNSGQSYLWSTGETTPTISASSSGIYTVEVSNGSCIIHTGLISIENVASDANLGGDTVICEGSLTLGTGEPGGGYLWSTGETTSSIVVSATGNYSVVRNNNNCTVSDDINVTLFKDNPFLLNPPNVFTPNGDGKNDLIDFNTGYFNEYNLVIYNRWGETIFSNNNTNPWDGLYKGENISEGVYFWVLNYKSPCLDSDFHLLKGTISAFL